MGVGKKSEEKKTRSPEASYSRRRKITAGILGFVFALIMSGGILAWKVSTDISKAMDKVYQQVDTVNMREIIAADEPVQEGEAEADRPETDKEKETETEKEEEKEVPASDPAVVPYLIQESRPMSILLIGTDTGEISREGESGLSDTLIYCVLNPEKESVSLLSIPRDTYTEIIGYGIKTKINAAYAYGGAQMCINTVQNLLQLPVDAYAAVNLDGFPDIIDAVGGVTVDNAFEFTHDDYYFAEGRITLNGEEALAYCRMRKQDPEGDFGRSRRQRQVITEVAKKAVSLSGAMNYQSILDVIADNIITNIDLDSAIDMFSSYEACLNNVHNYDTLKGKGMNDHGWYYVLDEAELQRVTAELKEELGI